MRVATLIFCTTFLLILSSPLLASGKSADIYIFAAASTTDVVNDIIKLYRAKSSSLIVKPSYGGSGALAKQVLSAAPANIFISANYEWIRFLDGKDMLIKSSIKELAKGRLVLISKKGRGNTEIVTINDVVDYLKNNKGKIAIGDPKSVPAGSYAMQVFDKLGITNDIKRYLVYSNSVRTALNYVKLGEVDFAITYYTDAFTEKDDYIIYAIDELLHEPITYWVAIVKGKDSEDVNSFFTYIFTDEVKAVFKKYGY